MAAQFIMDTHETLSEQTVRDVLVRTQEDNHSLDLSPLLTKFGERIVDPSPGSAVSEYYAVLAELAQLDRSQMRSFKKLFDWTVANAGGEQLELPCRLHSLSSTIGFVFVPVPAEAFHFRRNALQNFTMAMKHEFRLDRQIGVSVAKNGHLFEIDWMLLEAPWQPDPEIDRMLADNYPFRKRPSPTTSFRYQFSMDDEIVNRGGRTGGHP
jgi:hypothetical protein